MRRTVPQIVIEKRDINYGHLCIWRERVALPPWNFNKQLKTDDFLADGIRKEKGPGQCSERHG